MNKVTVYYHRVLPKIEIEGEVEVILVDAFEVDTLVVEYENVSIYRALREETVETYCTSENWISPFPGTSDDDTDQAFDSRNLPEIPPELLERYKGFSDDELKQKVIYAIDLGYISADGFNKEKL